MRFLLKKFGNASKYQARISWQICSCANFSLNRRNYNVNAVSLDLILKKSREFLDPIYVILTFFLPFFLNTYTLYKTEVVVISWELCEVVL